MIGLKKIATVSVLLLSSVSFAEGKLQLQETKGKELCIAPETKLNTVEDLNKEFKYLKCVSNCTLGKKLLQDLFNAYFGQGLDLNLENETIDFPYEIKKTLMAVIDVNLNDTADILVKELQIKEAGDIDVSQCNGTIITIKNNQLKAKLKITSDVAPKVDFLKQSWTNLLINSVKLDADISVDLSLDMIISQGDEDKISITASIPPGSVQISKNLQCTNNLGPGPGFAESDAAVTGAVCAESGPGCVITGPTIAIGWAAAFREFVEGSFVCEQIQDKFNTLVTQSFMLEKLQPMVQKHFGSKVCEVTKGAYGLDCKDAVSKDASTN